MSTRNKEAWAVIIADIHFTLGTLDIASQSLIQAFEKAFELEVPIIIAGDLTDGKAVIRGEVMNRLIEIFSHYCPPDELRPYIIIGNHDLLSEKAKEHALGFLSPYANLVSAPVHDIFLDLWLLPYFNDPNELQANLSEIPEGSTIIMHQGVQTANMGHYQVDKSSLPPEVFAKFRVISGHYHKAQDIKCGRPRKGALGLFSYVGSPYTTTFAEANDGPKGFKILYSDGILEGVPTHLRRHVIVERDVKDALKPLQDVAATDLLWLKITGPKSELVKIKKTALGKKLLGHSNFKLDLIPADKSGEESKKVKQTAEQLLDAVIDETAETPKQKSFLKRLWREL